MRRAPASPYTSGGDSVLLLAAVGHAAVLLAESRDMLPRRAALGTPSCFLLENEASGRRSALLAVTRFLTDLREEWPDFSLILVRPLGLMKQTCIGLE